LQTALAYRRTEELAVLRAANHLERRTDQLDAEVGEDSRLGQLAGEVERGLAAHRRQQGGGPLACEHAGHSIEIQRLEVGAVGEAGVGHDRRRIRVDNDGAEAVLAQDLQRLTAGVVELAGLPDHDRPGPDQADRLEVTPPWHTPPPRPRSR